MPKVITRGITALGLAVIATFSSVAPAAFATGPEGSPAASITTTLNSTTSYSTLKLAEVVPMDHDLVWRVWDDTIYQNISTCTARGETLANVHYTDIVAYRCVVRNTVDVVPQRRGMMLEVKRP